MRSVVIVAPGDPIPPNLPPQQKLQLQQMSSDHPPPTMASERNSEISERTGYPATMVASMAAGSTQHEMLYG